MKNSRLDETYRGLFETISRIQGEMKAERRESRRVLTIMVLTISASVLAAPLYLFMNGLFASLLWKWYIIPVFNLAPISWLQATGILLLVYVLASLLRKMPSLSEKKKDAEAKRSPREEFNAAKERLLLPLVGYFPGPITAFVFGWIIHFFI